MRRHVEEEFDSGGLCFVIHVTVKVPNYAKFHFEYEGWMSDIALRLFD
jgi:hypothetical protein